MKTTRTREWLTLSMLTLSGALAFGIFHYFAVRFIPPADDVRDYYAGVIGFVDHSPVKTIERARGVPAGRIGATLVLENNEAVALDASILIYRGLAATDRFEIDVIIPAFDPQSPFPYKFTIADARKGFSLVNRNFRLLSATPSFLHLEQVKY
jgi:hypothetical protein